MPIDIHFIKLFGKKGIVVYPKDYIVFSWLIVQFVDTIGLRHVIMREAKN